MKYPQKICITWFTYVWYLAESGSKRQKVEWWFPGAGAGGGGRIGSYCVTHTELQFCRDEKSSGDWLHTSVNVLNPTDLYT